VLGLVLQCLLLVVWCLICSGFAVRWIFGVVGCAGFRCGFAFCRLEAIVVGEFCLGLCGRSFLVISVGVNVGAWSSCWIGVLGLLAVWFSSCDGFGCFG